MLRQPCGHPAFLRECSVRSPGASGGRIRTPPLPGPGSNAYAARILADVKNCLDVQLGDRDRSGGHTDPLRPSAGTCETAGHRRHSSRTEGEGARDQDSRNSDGMRQPIYGKTWNDENTSSSRAPAHRQVPLAFRRCLLLALMHAYILPAGRCKSAGAYRNTGLNII